jgi:hypothetical protein
MSTAASAACGHQRIANFVSLNGANAAHVARREVEVRKPDASTRYEMRGTGALVSSHQHSGRARKDHARVPTRASFQSIATVLGWIVDNVPSITKCFQI